MRGIACSPNETELELQKKVVTDIFERKLVMMCKSIARIHRLGINGTNRLVKVCFQDFCEKQGLLRNAKELKGTKIFPQNGYSFATIKKLKLL